LKKIVIISLFLLAVLLSGCTQPVDGGDGGEGPPSTGYGTLVLKITDAPVEGLKALNVTVSGIEVHQTGATWVSFSEEEQTFDLMQLQGVADLLGEKELEAGQYTQIRLMVVKADLEFEDGNTAEVTVPSEKVKVVRPFSIDANEETELTIDFKPESVKKAGNKYIMTPVLKLLTPAEFQEHKRQIEREREQEQEGEGNGQGGQEQEGAEETNGEEELAVPEGIPGNLAIYFTDKVTDEIETLNVTFSSLDVHKTGGKWFSISNEEKTFDLLQLAGVQELFDQNGLEAGHYTMIRLDINKATLTLRNPDTNNPDGNNEEIEVTIPSNRLRFNHQFTVGAGETTELLVDFIVEKSVVKTGQGKWKLKPVVKIITLNEPEAPEELCGNGEVDVNETCASCPEDAGCEEGSECIDGACIEPVLCGNGVVDADEDCESCPEDVTCEDGAECVAGICVEINLCGNGVVDTNEACDVNGSIGCDVNTTCNLDCTACE
jgi:hypothetical protein